MQYSIANELSRDRKGFNWEVEVDKSLNLIKANFISNPVTSFDEWKKNKGKGCDILLPFAEVELKYRSKYYDRVSYIKRDHIPRFSCRGIDKIVVTNYKWFYGRKSREELYKYGIKLMDLQEFIWYVLKNMKGSNTIYLLFHINSLNYCMVCHYNGYLVTTIKDFFDG